MLIVHLKRRYTDEAPWLLEIHVSKSKKQLHGPHYLLGCQHVGDAKPYSRLALPIRLTKTETRTQLYLQASGQKKIDGKIEPIRRQWRFTSLQTHQHIKGSSAVRDGAYVLSERRHHRIQRLPIQYQISVHVNMKTPIDIDQGQKIASTCVIRCNNRRDLFEGAIRSPLRLNVHMLQAAYEVDQISVHGGGQPNILSLSW